MDFFNSIQYGLFPYTNKVIYPPFINIVYALFGSLTTIQNVHSTIAVRVTQIGALVYLLYTIFIVLMYSFLCKKIYTGKKAYLYICTTLLSAPFLYALERGNSILLTLALCIFFLAYFESEQKYQKYMSYVALGFAAGIKISPMLLGLILLRRRQKNEILPALVIGLVTFFIPFFFLDGNILILFQNIKNTAAVFQGTFIDENGAMKFIGQGAYVNIQNIFRFLSRLFNSDLYIIGNYVNIIILLIGLLEIFLLKKIQMWEILAIIIGIMVLTPGFSAVYNLVLFGIPLMYFFSENSKITRSNFFVIVCFLGIFIPLVNLKINLFSTFSGDRYPMVLSTAIESLSAFALIGFIEIKNSYKLIMEQQWPKITIIVGCLFIILGFFAYNNFFTPEYITNFSSFNNTNRKAIHDIAMINGQYRYISRKGIIQLKSEKVLKQGLQITFNKQKEENISQKRKVGIYINNQYVKTVELNPTDSQFIFLRSKEVKKYIHGESFLLEIKNLLYTEDNIPLDLLYAGPAKSISFLRGGSYINNSSSGIFQKKIVLKELNNQQEQSKNSSFKNNNFDLWMSNNGHALLDLSAVRSGLLIDLDIPEELMYQQRNKSVVLKISINDQFTKIVTIEKAGRTPIIIQPDEIKKSLEQLEQDQDDDILDVCLELENIQVNSSTIDRRRNKIIKINYIGGLANPEIENPNLLPIYLPFIKPYYTLDLPKTVKQSQIQFFSTSLLGEQGISIVYMVPKSVKYKTIGPESEIRVRLDGKVVQEERLSKIEYGQLHVINIAKNNFQDTDHVIKIELESDEPILLKYWGPVNILAALKQQDDKETTWFTQGLKYDNWTKHWGMGKKVEIALANSTLKNGPVKFVYQVNSYLLKANPNQDIILSIRVNDQMVKEIPITAAGNFTEMLAGDTLNKIVKNSYGTSVITISSNATYNLSEMAETIKEDQDRSVDIIYLGPDD